MCRLIIDGVDVIVASRAEQIYGVEPFAMHGLDLTGYKVLAIKWANHLRAGYRTVAGQIISVDSEGLSTAAIASLPRERFSGRFWPLSDEVRFDCGVDVA
ncbi:MlrC C-terminal domain-containing protein [Cupriavidus necator]|uniref:MlrC C-terminal domain-containing protein n=1 Tax=Cupriavidus necator TaxID=106590 RepID=UPI0027D7BE56|nr:MlrC C-terminal domain-containing protein [Cupriavidus necator]